MAPKTVKKKNEYSPKPLKVSRARKFPNSRYGIGNRVARIVALMGASDRGAD